MKSWDHRPGFHSRLVYVAYRVVFALTRLSLLGVAGSFVSLAQDINFGEAQNFTIQPGQSANRSLYVEAFSFSGDSGCGLGLCVVKTPQPPIPIAPSIPWDEYTLTGLRQGYQYQIQITKTGGTSGFMVYDRADHTDSGLLNVTSYKKIITATAAYSYGPIDVTLITGAPSFVTSILGLDQSSTTQYTISVTQLTQDQPVSGVAPACFLIQVPACTVPSNFFYPDGTLFKSPTSSTVYVLENGHKRPFTSAFHFNSWFHGKWSAVVTVSDQELTKYPTGSQMPFKDGTITVYQDRPGDQTVFIIQNSTRHAFTSLADFLGMGYNLNSIMPVRAGVLDMVFRGADVAHIFSSTVPPSSNTLTELFDNQYPTRWTYTVASGTPVVTASTGDLNVRAPVSGSGASFLTKQTLSGNVDVTFSFNHHGFGRTMAGLFAASSNAWPAAVTLDTNDTAYLDFSNSTQDTGYTFSSAPYMNQNLAVRILVIGGQVQFFVNGTLMKTMAFASTGSYQLALAFGSVPWKSGDNISDFFSVKATADSISSLPAPIVTPLAVSLSASNQNPRVGESVTLTAAVSGGTGTGYVCSWSFSNSTACQLTLTPSVAGFETITVTAMDNDGNQKQTSLTLNVQSASTSALTATCSVNGSSSAQSFQVGNQIIWNANVNGGSGSDNFTWSGISGGNTASVVLVPIAATIYNASVTVSDSGTPKQQVSVGCPQVTIIAAPAFSGGCTISPNPGLLGGGETVLISTIGGTSPITYSINGISIGSSNSNVVLPSQTGNYTAAFGAKEGTGKTISGSCSAQINMVTPAISGYTLGSTPKHGKNFNISAAGSNFAGGAAVYFYGPGCSSGCQQPQAGVAVDNPNPVSGSISISNIQLGSGSYYFRVMNPGGYWSGNSASFSVQ